MDLPRPRALATLLPTTIVGTILGALLLLATPARAFELVVPFLVLGATAVLAFQDPLRRLVGHPAGTCRPRRRTVTVQTMVALGAVYGGYFGAALGVMLVAGLALVLDATLARVSAIKNLLSAVVGLTTLVVFAAVRPGELGGRRGGRAGHPDRRVRGRPAGPPAAAGGAQDADRGVRHGDRPLPALARAELRRSARKPRRAVQDTQLQGEDPPQEREVTIAQTARPEHRPDRAGCPASR